MKFTADLDSIGDGWLDPWATVCRWNDYIAPVLMNAAERDGIDNPTDLLLTAVPGWAAVAMEWAWEEFCSTGAGDSDDAVIALGKVLKLKLT